MWRHSDRPATWSRPVIPPQRVTSACRHVDCLRVEEVGEVSGHEGVFASRYLQPAGPAFAQQAQAFEVV
jgi:hypothetical protein